ncbi:MAG: lipopolysaccharide heptosyltransferase II [Candidatus Omnitrophota bacterium]
MQKEPLRILVIRTDRIGDILLSTPVIKNLRLAYPDAYIAMMCRSYTLDIVKYNPYLNEVIAYDQDNLHKGWFSSMKFALMLGKKKFDLALILHPTNRAHILAFFAGIPRRVGFDRKLPFLLTQKIKDTKFEGEKHEMEYALDVLRAIGIEPKDKTPFMQISKADDDWAIEFLKKNNVRDEELLVAINPGASCPSRRWPVERFAEVADAIIKEYNAKVLVISGPEEVGLGEKVIRLMHYPAIDASGKTTVAQLAALLKHCKLIICTDTGPMHIAATFGASVIVMFGRNQRGLSPLRWGPLAKNSTILHKEVGCIECLAHNCTRGFKCLKAITVEDVLSAVEEILKGP